MKVACVGWLRCRPAALGGVVAERIVEVRLAERRPRVLHDVELGALGLPGEEARGATVATGADDQVDVLYWAPGELFRDRIHGETVELPGFKVENGALNGIDYVCVSVVADSEREMPGAIGRFLDRALERCSGRGRKQVQIATDVELPTLSRLHPVRDDLLDQREEVADLLGVTLADVVGGQDVGAGMVDVPGAEPGHEVGEVLRPGLVAGAHVNMPLSLRPASIAVHDDPDVAWPRDGQRCRAARRVAEFHDLTVGRAARRRPVSATVSTGSPLMGASRTPSTGHPSRTGGYVSPAQLSLAAEASGAACSLPPRTPSAVAETSSGADAATD